MDAKLSDINESVIIVGGVNDEEFLNDPTGDRRFWVIPLQQKVDLELLKQERDPLRR